ncbi:hypothetical protein BH11PLA2_BH11PLA2_23750 [soil metagenome]
MHRPFDQDAVPGMSSVTAYTPPPYASPYYTTPSPAAILPAARSIPTVWGLLNALKRRWVLATFLGLLAAFAAAAGFWLAAPTGKHQIKAIVEIQPLRTTLDDRNGGNDNGYDDFKRNQEVLVKTRTLLQKVAQSPKVSVLPMISGSDDPVRSIEGLIDTKWPGPSLMAILMNGDQPDQLIVIMNVLVEKYVEQSKLDMQADLEDLKRTLKKNFDDEKASYDNQMENINAMNRNSVSGSEPRANSELLIRQNEKIGNAEKTEDELRRKITTIEARVNQTKKRLENPATLKAAPSTVENALEQDLGVATARADYEQAVLVLKDAEKKLADPNLAKTALGKYQTAVNLTLAKYNDVKDTRRPQIEKILTGSVKAELEQSLIRDEADLATFNNELIRVKKTLVDLIDDYKLLVRKTNMVFAETDIAYIKENMNKIRGQITRVNQMLSGNGRIVEKEKPTVIPNPNIKQKMFFGAALAGMAFAAVLLIVAYLEWRSRRVDNVDQVLNELNMRILGTIPAFPSRASLKAGEADLNQNWRFILNESVNSARTMLLHSAKTQNMQVLMVTSAMQGEGKTSLASQLATSMATAGLRTLILDLDLRNPSMNRLFDLPLGPGASEILLQEIDVSDAVQPTTVPNLWLIPAGQCSNRVIACLAQGHPIENLFNRLRGQFDFIVVDTCPVLPVADALLIGQHVDGVVFSILQDISQLPKVLNASERLSQLNIPLLGAVVNGIKTDVHAYGYNYVKQLPA